MSEVDSLDIDSFKKNQACTTRSTIKKMDFIMVDSFGDSDSGLTNKQRIEYEYLKKRDPMKEFFSLVSVYAVNFF